MNLEIKELLKNKFQLNSLEENLNNINYIKEFY